MAMTFYWTDLGLGPVRSLDERLALRKEWDPEAVSEFCEASGEIKFEKTLEEIVRNQEVWTIWSNDVDQIVEYGRNPTWTPIFPTQAVARYAQSSDPDVRFIPIPLNHFVDQIVTFLSRESIFVGLSPTAQSDDTVCIYPNDLLVDIVSNWETFYETEAESSEGFDAFASRTFYFSRK